MTKKFFKIFTCLHILFICFCKSYGQNITPLTPEKYAIKQVNKIKKNNNHKLFTDTLIKTKETAIAVAESIVFEVYGKKNIIDQRPYNCFFIDEYWFVTGTLPKNVEGGVFEIIISSKDGKVVSLIHGK